jgi:hypothetical protein
MKLFIGNWKILGNDSDILSYPEQKRDIVQLLQYLDEKDWSKVDKVYTISDDVLTYINYLIYSEKIKLKFSDILAPDYHVNVEYTEDDYVYDISIEEWDDELKIYFEKFDDFNYEYIDKINTTSFRELIINYINNIDIPSAAELLNKSDNIQKIDDFISEYSERNGYLLKKFKESLHGINNWGIELNDMYSPDGRLDTWKPFLMHICNKYHIDRKSLLDSIIDFIVDNDIIEDEKLTEFLSTK